MARMVKVTAWSALLAAQLQGCGTSGEPSTGGQGGDVSTGGQGGAGASGGSGGAGASGGSAGEGGMLAGGQGGAPGGAGGQGGAVDPNACDPAAEPGSLYELSAESMSIDEIDPISMCRYRGDVLLIANIAAI
jgi:hypothetical protein